MDDLATWLRAQLDEDERAANWLKKWAGDGDFAKWMVDPVVGPFGGQSRTRDAGAGLDIIKLADPDRALREVEAKRRILDEVAQEATSLDMQVDGEFRVGSRDTTDEPYLGDVLRRLLAMPYADRPGYREEWRP